MHIHINNDLTEDYVLATDYLERRIQFSLDRYAPHIKSIRFRLCDINGPRGGEDKRCSALIKTQSGKELFIACTESSWKGAIDITLEKVNRSMSKVLDHRYAKRFQSGMVPKDWGIHPDTGL